MTSSRISLRDRHWFATPVIRVVGPLAGCDRRQILAALRATPDPRVRARIGPGWRWTTEDPDDRVREAAGPATPEALAAYLYRQPLVDRSLILGILGPYVGIKASHAFGDGRVIDALLADLVTGRALARPTPSPSAAAPTRLPLVRALVRHFAHHPAALAALRIDRPPPAGTPGGAPPTSITFRAASSTAETLRALRAYRDERLPGVSVAALVSAAVFRGFAASASPYPGSVVLIDGRRYLPPGSVVPGNFSWGQYVRPIDPYDPRAHDRAIRAELDSGRALVMLALRDLHTMVSHPGPAPDWGPVAVPRPILSLSHLGRLTAFDAAPWQPEPAARFISVVPPAGPSALSVAVAEMSGALHITATFCAEVFAPPMVEAAIQTAVTDPRPRWTTAGRS